MQAPVSLVNRLEQRTTLSFSNGWLQFFKKRHGLRFYNSYGEVGDSDGHAAVTALPRLRQIARQYTLNDIFNADEFALYYTAAPSSRIGPAPLLGRKKSKERVTVLYCKNADGTDKLPPLIIGRLQNPRCFGNGGGAVHGIDYEGSGKCWMNNGILSR